MAKTWYNPFTWFGGNDEQVFTANVGTAIGSQSEATQKAYQEAQGMKPQWNVLGGNRSREDIYTALIGKGYRPEVASHAVYGMGLFPDTSGEILGANVATPDLGGVTGGGGGVDYSAINAARDEVLAKRDRARKQFEELYPKEQANLEEAAGKGRTKVGEQAFEGDKTLSETFATQRPQLEQSYAARGLADSSYKDKAIDRADASFNEALSKLSKNKAEELKNIDDELKKGKETLERMKNNFYNPDNPQFGSLDEVYAYGQQLDQTLKQIEDQRTQLRNSAASMASASVSPEAAMAEMTNALASLASNPTSIGGTNDAYAGQIISNYYSRPEDQNFWLKWYKDYAKTLANG